MLIRQKVLLHLVGPTPISRLRLVKLAFLLACQSRLPQLETFYQFVPYRNGPFSFTLYHELDSLMQNGYLESPSGHMVELGSHVRVPSLASEIKRDVSLTMRKYSGLSTRELVNLVYSEYPSYTFNSVLSVRHAPKPPPAQCAVYTVGYEGLQVDGFLSILVRAGVQRLIDVRQHPISRRYGFHRSTLSKLCKHLGLEYEHTPEVGIPSILRANLQSYEDYEQLLSFYESEILPAQDKTVDMIARWMQSLPSVLVCMEANPRYCHRLCLAKQVARKNGLSVQDLRTGICDTPTLQREFLSLS